MVIRIKKNDSYDGKRTHNVIIDLLKKSNISGATVWAGVEGYGKRGKSGLQIEGITMNMPLIIEVVEELPKIELVLPAIKKVIGENGLITMHEVGTV